MSCYKAKKILFSEFNINYNNEPDQFKKGTTIFRKKVEIPLGESKCNSKGKIEDEKGDYEEKSEEHIEIKERNSRERRKRTQEQKEAQSGIKIRTKIVQENCDIIRDEFWTENDQILGSNVS